MAEVNVLSRLMPIDEVAPLLGVSVYTVRRLITADLLRSVRIGTRVMIPSEEVARVQREGARTRPDASQSAKQRKQTAHLSA